MIIIYILAFIGSFIVAWLLLFVIIWGFYKGYNVLSKLFRKHKANRKFNHLNRDLCVVWDNEDETPMLGIDAAGDCAYMLEEYSERDWWNCNRVPFAHKIPLKEFNLERYKDENNK